MSNHLPLILQILSTALLFVLSLLAGATVWYVRKHLIPDVEKNTEMRKYLMGTAFEKDTGEFDTLALRLEQIEVERKQDHEEVKSWMNYLTNYVRNIADAVNGAQYEPEEGPPDDFYRGGDD